MKLPIDCLGCPQVRVPDPSGDKDLLKSIRETGVLKPILVVRRQRSWIVIDGVRRVEACKKLGITEIEVRHGR